MYEQYGRKLKPGVKVKVLAKPFRTLKCNTAIRLLPTKDEVGKVLEVVGPPHYYTINFIPDVPLIDKDGKQYNIEVTSLRIINE